MYEYMITEYLCIIFFDRVKLHMWIRYVICMCRVCPIFINCSFPDVFRTTKSLGSFPAILSTYAVSSLLHGLNFQLAAVLLSLGAYTYVEYVLRCKLANVFGACILVRQCKKDCSHRNKEKRFPVIFANICLGVIAMFHLSYLGVMFDSSSKLQEDGYNYQHTLSKWSHLSYVSHWVCLGSYFFYLLI